MIKGGKGGAKTQSGLVFESKVKLEDTIRALKGYEVRNGIVLRGGSEVARLFYKRGLYKNLLEPRGVDYSKLISKRLEPDSALLVGNTLYIIEIKFQEVGGSVDEKIQTCDFKRRQYEKLCQPLGLKVVYAYVLSEFFSSPGYEDVRNYIRAVGCHYFFKTIPLDFLGLDEGPIEAS
ncbi:MAG: hypothetical protein AB1725_09765 [Armatimonadota bacterium]